MKDNLHILPSKLAQLEHLLLDFEAQNLEDEQRDAGGAEKLALWLKIEEIREKQRKLLKAFPLSDNWKEIKFPPRE